MPANFVIATPTVDAEFSAAGTGADNCRSERTSPAPVDCPAMETPHNQLLLADEQKMYDIEKPHHHDVLCGRGVTTNRHPGNESFRSLVSLNKELYVSSTKRQKMSISRSIVEAVRSLDPPGRFLEKDPVTSLWSDIGHKKAVEKTSQALRDGAASLRKQLSADLGDPEFLSAVFDMDEEKEEQESGKGKGKGTPSDKKENDEKKKQPLKDKEMEVEEETGREKERVRSTEKARVAKAKPAPVKKGHRRVKSTPNSGTAHAARHHRKPKAFEPPPSPLARVIENFRTVPPSPCSPHPRGSVSHPNSPMTWGGRISFSENQSPGSLGPIPQHSPYEQPSPTTFSPYGQPAGHYSRSHGYEAHGSHPPDHRPPLSPHGWSYPSSRYRPQYPGTSSRALPPPAHHAPEHPHGNPTPAHTSSGHIPPRHASPGGHHISHPSPHVSSHMNAHPQSPLPNGPLPPGRHQFSPSGYRSKPHPSEWSPRSVPHHQSPRRFSPHKEHHPRQSPRWSAASSSPHHDPYVPHGRYAQPDSTASDGGLSVPALGGEGKYSKASLSPKVLLSPRSHKLPYRQAPPRPPAGNYTHRDFAPPPASPRIRHSNGIYTSRSEGGANRSVNGSEIRTSPVEEKKADSGEDECLAPYPSLTESSFSPPPFRLKPRVDRSRNPIISSVETATSGGAAKQEIDLAQGETVDKLRAYEETTEDDQPVDDIAMSPLPFEREDPATLMELPENIMALPISPCGPNDESGVGAK